MKFDYSQVTAQLLHREINNIQIRPDRQSLYRAAYRTMMPDIQLLHYIQPIQFDHQMFNRVLLDLNMNNFLIREVKYTKKEKLLNIFLKSICALTGSFQKVRGATINAARRNSIF